MTDIDIIIDYMEYKSKQFPVTGLRDWLIDVLIMDDTRTRLLLNLLRESTAHNNALVVEIIREQLECAYGEDAKKWKEANDRRTEIGVFEDQARGI